MAEEAAVVGSVSVFDPRGEKKEQKNQKTNKKTTNKNVENQNLYTQNLFCRFVTTGN